MVMTDPISDMLNRIKNASNALLDKVDIPSSKVKVSIAEIMKREGFIKNYRVTDEKNQKTLRVYLKYGESQEKCINGIKRISKPSRRVYSKHNRIPYVLNGYSIAVVSTSSGILTDKECRKKHLGGEVVCYIW